MGAQHISPVRQADTTWVYPLGMAAMPDMN